jgi:hypothetical protein
MEGLTASLLEVGDGSTIMTQKANTRVCAGRYCDVLQTTEARDSHKLKMKVVFYMTVPILVLTSRKLFGN